MSGQLDNSSADALAAAICAALGTSVPADLSHWETICRQFYSKLKADITITIQTGTIVTNGGPTTQTGPAAPVPINPN